MALFVTVKQQPLTETLSPGRVSKPLPASTMSCVIGVIRPPSPSPGRVRETTRPVLSTIPVNMAGSARSAQGIDLVHELARILEVLVDRSKAHVGDLIQLVEAL